MGKHPSMDRRHALASIRVLTVSLWCLLLAACGGGSNSTASNSLQPTAQEQAEAKAAALSGAFDTSNGTATLSWTDTVTTASAYQIEEEAGGTWSVVASVPGQQGSQKALTWSGTLAATATLRVEALVPGSSVVLQTGSGQQSVQVVVPSGSPAIVLSQSQPIWGNVGVSIGGGGTYSSVNYYVDLQSFGSSSTGPGYGVTLAASSLTTGSHLILARLATSADSYIELRLTVNVSPPQPPPPPPITVQVSKTGTPLAIYVTLAGPFVARSVTATINGTSLGSLSAPNSCKPGETCGTAYDAYQFTVNEPSGSYSVTAVATDSSNKTETTTLAATVDNPPTLTVSSPGNGAVLYGTLHLSGTFGTDKAGGATLTATLGSVPILKTTISQSGAAPFSANFDLTGVTTGGYTLTVTATDRSGEVTTAPVQVLVTSSAIFANSPLATLPQQATLLAAESATLLYQPQFGGPHLLSGGTDTVLAPVPSLPNAPSHWELANGYVFADNQSDVYMWAADGSVTNLSTLAGEAVQGASGLLSVQWPWALWTGPIPAAALVFYNVATGQEFNVALPAGSIGINPPAGFYLTQGQLHLYYSAQTQGGASLNIFTWSQSSGQSTAVTSGASNQYYYPQTDGQRVAWQIAGGAPNLNGEPLVALDIASSTQQTVSNDEVPGFVLADGLLAWFEITDPTSGNWDFKVSEGTTTTTVLTGTGYSNPTGTGGGNALTIIGTGGGVVAFGANSKIYAWSASHGLQVVCDFAPLKVLMSGTTLFVIPNAASNAVYTATLQ